MASARNVDLLGIASVVLRNRPLTRLFPTVQSIDFLMECMVWRFWMMRQSNVSSTPASRSSAASQWIVTTHSND